MTAVWEKLPELHADERAGLRWWVCTCGRPLHAHPWINTDGNRWLTCALNGKGRFESETRRVEYTPGGGLKARFEHDPEPRLS